jgi:hypothetical protein
VLPVMPDLILSVWLWKTSTCIGARGVIDIEHSNWAKSITGIDRAGHDFSYSLASTVDASGQLLDGKQFRDVRELETHLCRESSAVGSQPDPPMDGLRDGNTCTFL